ncbi:MAG: hypothetical protein WBA68_00540 [Alteraurantiacibacter sp.]
MSIALALAMSAIAAHSGPDPFLTFSRDPATDAVRTVVEVGILRSDGRNAEYWLKRTQFTNGAEEVSESWADSESCPAARDAVRSAVDLTPPQVSVPGVDMAEDGSYWITLDGVRYELSSSAHYDSNIGSEIRFTSNVGTPLSEWVEASLLAMADCWGDAPPEGYPGPSGLF